jgi:sugar lactone lactonase YvrE
VSNEERYVSKVQTCFPHTLVQRRPSLTYDLKHGCGKVIRISPQGKVLAEVKFPTRCVTCPGFAGEDLYVTSAEEEDPVRFPNSTKLQGAIFKIHVGIRGLRPHKFKLNV